MPFTGVPKRIIISLTLLYIARVINNRDPYNYTHPSWSDTTESDYQSITWLDNDTQPTWEQIQQHYEAAWDWGYRPDAEERLKRIEDYLMLSLAVIIIMGWFIFPTKEAIFVEDTNFAEELK